mmetsp:Transcript_112844/g.364422  ORF Transcript_112844/g.364422 Transcript_112844/m.364422 type:complete len:423 (+) Transcript_112844:341-1609(+)
MPSLCMHLPAQPRVRLVGPARERSEPRASGERVVGGVGIQDVAAAGPAKGQEAAGGDDGIERRAEPEANGHDDVEGLLPRGPGTRQALVHGPAELGRALVAEVAVDEHGDEGEKCDCCAPVACAADKLGARSRRANVGGIDESAGGVCRQPRSIDKRRGRLGLRRVEGSTFHIRAVDKPRHHHARCQHSGEYADHRRPCHSTKLKLPAHRPQRPSGDGKDGHRSDRELWAELGGEAASLDKVHCHVAQDHRKADTACQAVRRNHSGHELRVAGNSPLKGLRKGGAACLRRASGDTAVGQACDCAHCQQEEQGQGKRCRVTVAVGDSERVADAMHRGGERRHPSRQGQPACSHNSLGKVESTHHLSHDILLCLPSAPGLGSIGCWVELSGGAKGMRRHRRRLPGDARRSIQSRLNVGGWAHER